MAVTVKHSTPADGTFSATGAAAWNADHNFTGTIDVTNGGTGANTLTANALLKGNGTSAISASSVTDDGSLVTIAEPVRLSTPNGSYAAWTTSGINLIQSAATFTDTTSTGTVGNVYMNRFNAQTLAASNATTVVNLCGTYFSSPAAGANVTATNTYGVGADNALITGTLTTNGISQISVTTGSASANFATGVTASGSTKTVNIGTNGASGSTTAITIGSATSGATQTTTVNGRVTLAPIGASAAAWTTNGIGLVQSAATFTDTTSTGNVSQVIMNRFNAQTLAASNVITATNLFGTYFTDPTAGTNVTATNRYALGVDSISVAGALVGSGAISWSATGSSTIALGSSTGTGIVQLGRSTLSQTVEVAQGTTASGNTKTVNIGTGGASGSTTNITLGSSTSGATQTTTVNGQVTLAPIGGSAAAWTTSGIALKQSAATWTDTTSTGTVTNVHMNRFNAQTLAASNATTVTILYGSYFTDPTAGTNVTASNRYAIGADSIRIANDLVVGGILTGAGTLTLTGPTTTTTAAFATGVTASGSTKTVNLGTGGASGSTTNITIGSSTSGATSTTTLNGKTTFAGTAQLQGYTVATLPVGTQGMTAFVTDALAPAWNMTLVGGGAVVCKAFYNGTAWVAG